jgi:hypothetical protein
VSREPRRPIVGMAGGALGADVVSPSACLGARPHEGLGALASRYVRCTKRARKEPRTRCHDPSRSRS